MSLTNALHLFIRHSQVVTSRHKSSVTSVFSGDALVAAQGRARSTRCVYTHLPTSVYTYICICTTIHYYIYSIIQYAHQALPLPPTPRHVCQHKWPPRPDECRRLCWYTYISTCIIIHYNIHIVMQYAIVRRYYIYLDLYIALVNAHARARARARALSLSLSLSHTPAEPLARVVGYVFLLFHTHTLSLSYTHT
jgi:hypothetical protein